MTETTASAARTWQGELINGKFRIGQQLGGSDHSSVFLTQFGEQARAAIKIVPVEREDPARLAQVRHAAGLDHRHLLKIFDSGYCRLGETVALYVVMEYAEEDLSLVLPERSLTETETRDMLQPVLEVLANLHASSLVHGALKPSNIMAVGDRLKLSSDTICAIGSRHGSSLPTPYDAPELTDGTFTPAADAWSLGVTITQVLTQRFPEWQGAEPVLPAALAFPFPQIVRRCLSLDPTQRWNVADISACLPIGALPQKSVQPPDRENTFDLRRWRYPAIGLAGAVVVAGLLLSSRDREPGASPKSETPNEQVLSQKVDRSPIVDRKPSAAQRSAQSAAEPSQPVARQEEERVAEPKAAVRTPAAQSSAPGAVVHEVLPDVPQKAMNTIQGKLKNSVRIVVDPAGNVIEARMQSAGPSRYFASFSERAARDWKFEPRDGASEWIVSFEFKRDGVTARAAEAR